MHLSLSLYALQMAGILCLMSVQVVESFPLVNRASKFITLPLKRAEQARYVHGQIYLQLHINRAIRRLARMTRHQEPTDEELLVRLERRIISIEGPEGLERRTLDNRYRHVGVSRKPKPASGAALLAGSKMGSKVEKNRKKKTGKAKGYADAQAGGMGGNKGNENFIQLAGGPNDDTGNSAQAGGENDNDNTGNAALANGVTLANQPTANNSLGLHIEAHDGGYLATIQLGTPPQDFRILVDSGSSDLWIGAENCHADTGRDCGNHNFLGPKSSSSFVDTKAQFQITYGTGRVSGNVVTDNLVLGNLKLPDHSFGVATTESVEFFSDNVSFDGLMGLGKSIGSQQKVLTAVEALAKANLISDPIVSYKISRLADNLNDGEITFGGLDPTKFDAQTLVVLPNVNQGGLWEADIARVSVNGDDTCLIGRTAILDTGTTLLAVPPDDATAIHAAIGGSRSDGQGGFTVPCTLTDKVSLQFGDQSFEIDPRDIALVPLDPNDPEAECTSGVIATPITGIGATQWLVGDVFLKNVYFSTDVSKNTLSLAKLV